MPRVAKPLFVLICLAVLSLVLVRAAVAEEQPAPPPVDLRTGAGAVPVGSKLAFGTTSPEFCTSLLLQAPTQGFTTTLPVQLTAYELLPGDGSAAATVTPRLSAEGCNDPAAASTLQLADFKPGTVRQVWLALTASTIATYTGPLLIQLGTAPPTIYTVEVARRPLELAIEQPTAGSFTVATKAEIFTRTLAVRLPDNGGTVAPLQYSYTLERTDGAETAPASLILLHDGQDANNAPVELPAGTRVPLTLVGRLPESGSYTGQLLLHYGDGQTKIVPLDLQQIPYTQAEGLVFPTPEPSRWTAEPWQGANAQTTFQLENTSDVPIPLHDVKLVALNQVEDGKVVASLLDQARSSLAGSVVSGGTLDRHSIGDVVLTVDGLPAGEYEARVSALTPDGRKVESATKFFVRHQLMPFLVVGIFLIFAWLIQDWATTGRKRAMADLRLNQLGAQIQSHLRDAAVLPAWLRPHDEPQRAWIALDRRLETTWTNARLARSVAESENVSADIGARVTWLDEALSLAQSVDGMLVLNKTPEGDPARLAVTGEVLRQLQKLYRLLEGPKDKLDESTAGAPSVIAALKTELHRVRRMRFDTQIKEIRRGLDSLQAEPGLADDVKTIRTEVDAVSTALDDPDFDAAGIQNRLAKAEDAYYELLWRHLAPEVQVAQLAGQLHRLDARADMAAYTAAAAAFAAAEQALPASGLAARARVEKWQAAEPQLWLAQLKIWQAELAAGPGDLKPGEWKNLPGYTQLSSSLAAAEGALQGGGPAARRAYEEARSAQLRLQCELLCFRLEHLVLAQLGASGADQTGWLPLQAEAVQLRSKISAYGTDQLTQENMLNDRLEALKVLVRDLELASKAFAGDAFKAAAQLTGWAEQYKELAPKVAAARSTLDAALAAKPPQGSDPAQKTGPEEKVAGAETAYVAAAVPCKNLLALWQSTKSQAQSALEGMPSAGFGGPRPVTLLSGLAVALFAGPQPAQVDSTTPLDPDYANYLELDAQQRKRQDEYRLGQYQKQISSITWQIRYRNLLVYIVAFLITVLFAVVDKVFSNPTFGDWPDYITLILFAFGATGISNATMGTIMNTLGLQPQQQ